MLAVKVKLGQKGLVGTSRVARVRSHCGNQSLKGLAIVKGGDEKPSPDGPLRPKQR